MLVTIKDKFRTDEKVLIECDFKISPKCKKRYEKVFKNVLKGRANNDGKDRCQYCFNSLTKTGTNNYNFKYEKEERFFQNIDNEIKAYLLGWVAGDGCLKKDGLYISVHWVDRDILDLFRLFICPNKELIFRDYDKTFTLIINSVTIMRDLLNWLDLENYGKKSDKIKLPNISNDLLWHFIRGLFDSDGSILSPFKKITSPQCNICSTSLKMQKDLLSFLKKNSFLPYKSPNSPNISFTGFKCLNFLDKLYSNASYYLIRKKSYYIIWKTWMPYKGIFSKKENKNESISNIRV